jgi:thiazole/oxazole-forming peptide maturase SagD family component
MVVSRFRILYRYLSPARTIAEVYLPQNRKLPRSHRAPAKTVCSGSGGSLGSSKLSAFGEAVERYSYIFQGSEPVIFGAQREVEGEWKVISPRVCNQYTAGQYAERDAWNAGLIGFPYIPKPVKRDEAIAWTAVWSLTRGETMLAPTQHCYFYSNPPSERLVCVADSNGCAAGESMERAVEHGLLELIERDAIALWWTARVAKPGLGLPDEAEAEEIVSEFEARKRKVWLLDLSTDTGVPVAAAIAASEAKPARFSLGFGAAFGWRRAILRALYELRQNEAIHEEGRHEGELHSMHNAHLAWLAEATLDSNPHFVARDSGGMPRQAEHDSLESLLKDFAGRGWDVCALDLSRPETKTAAVRVIAPDLAAPYHRMGSKRVKDALKRGFGPNPAPFSL